MSSDDKQKSTGQPKTISLQSKLISSKPRTGVSNITGLQINSADEERKISMDAHVSDGGEERTLEVDHFENRPPVQHRIMRRSEYNKL